MQWRGRRESTNVEDRRRMGGGATAAGVGGMGIVGVILYLLMGGDPQQVLQQTNFQMPGQAEQGQYVPSAEEDSLAAFMKVVLADNEDVWNKIFSQSGKQYVEPSLILFRGSVQSACGGASSQMGPFYCPGDQKVYLDLSFAKELRTRFGAAGDFAMAYVVAHEVGHHVQHLIGSFEKGERLKRQGYDKNQVSVATELQADFFAGVWARHTQDMKGVLDIGDIEEAMRAASAVGDDAIQKKTQGYVVPDGFTHGTSEQRMEWFRRGYQSGDPSKGTTFEEVL